jgi:hypothetical protein
MMRLSWLCYCLPWWTHNLSPIFGAGQISSCEIWLLLYFLKKGTIDALYVDTKNTAS